MKKSALSLEKDTVESEKTILLASNEFLEIVTSKANQMGVSIQAVGDMKSMSDSMGVLTGALLLSILLMYFAMVLLYNNWIDPLVVMFSIPFSIFLF